MKINTISHQQNNNISIVQFSTSSQNTLDYISGPRALEQKQIIVKEVSEQADVNKILMINSSSHYTFFSDGDILTGAKQNRILNTSVLIAPGSKLVLPVSCVEQGRWNYSKPLFNQSPDIGTRLLRAKKSRKVKESLEIDNNFNSDQGEVWDDVAHCSKYLEEQSPTQDLSELYDKKNSEFEELLNNFKLNDQANGISVFVKNKLLHIEIFNRTDIYSEYFPKILRSALVETFRLKNSDNRITDAEAYYKTQELIDLISDSEHSEYPGVGVGIERRFESDQFIGFELNHKNLLVHHTILNLSN